MDTPPDAVVYDESLKNSDEFPAIPIPAPGLAATLRLLHDVLRAGSSVDSTDTISVTTSSHSGHPAAFSLSQPFIRLRLPTRFTIRRVLGKGGFGCVYLAFDSLLKRDVAIKVPHGANSENDELKSRFLRESRAVARLNHPSIVRVLDCGESDSMPWQSRLMANELRLADGQTKRLSMKQLLRSIHWRPVNSNSRVEGIRQRLTRWRFHMMEPG